MRLEERRMRCRIRIGTVIVIAAVLAGCFGPEDRRPGLHLRGEVVADAPSDWAFTDAHREIAIEVHTPYLLPHSVTIWCATIDGELYLGARDPDTKRWPGWVDRDPDVRLGIGSKVYEVQLTSLEDSVHIKRVQQAYRSKYELPARREGEGPPIRYWRVGPRA